MEYSTEYLKVANTRNFFPIIAHKSVPLDIHDDKKLQSSFQRSFDFEVEYVLKELVEQFKPYRHTNTRACFKIRKLCAKCQYGKLII